MEVSPLRAHAGAKHHADDGADDAARNGQHEVVDHVRRYALPEACVDHLAADHRLRATGTGSGRGAVGRAAERARARQRCSAVVDGGVVAAQVEAAAGGGRAGIGQCLQAELIDHLAQCSPLGHAFAPDQGVQIQFAPLEALADFLDRQRALALLSFGVVPLGHCMFPVGSSLEVLPCTWLSRGTTAAGTCRRFHRCIPSGRCRDHIPATAGRHRGSCRARPALLRCRSGRC